MIPYFAPCRGLACLASTTSPTPVAQLLTSSILASKSNSNAINRRSFYHALVPFGLPPDCVMLHMGEHQLKDVEGTTPLYLALPSKLACRWGGCNCAGSSASSGAAAAAPLALSALIARASVCSDRAWFGPVEI